jgi:predicted small secreted protein
MPINEARKIMRPFPLVVIAISALLLVGACNTVEGAGKDVQSAGQAVANTANEAK